MITTSGGLPAAKGSRKRGSSPVVATNDVALGSALEAGSGEPAEPSGIDGNALRHLRREAGLSLRELAERAHVSTSLISQVERGQATPSLQSLRRIVSSLNVSIFQLLMATDAEQRVVTADSRRKIILKTEGISYELLSPDTKHKIEAWLGRVELNDVTPEPSQHPSEEFIHVLRGRMEITISSDVYLLGPGDSIQYDGNRPHTIRNVGATRLDFLSALTPPTL